MYEINQDRQLELLKRLLFAWDAQWFLKTAASVGPDEALKINGRVRAAYGRLEMKAMLALLGKTQADNLADALEIIKTFHTIAYSHNPILSGTHLVANETAAGRGKALVSLARCAVLDNAKRSALPANPNETNCVYCQMLWTTWLENLLPEAQIDLNYESGQMQGAPHGLLLINCFRAATGTGTTVTTPAAPIYPEPTVAKQPASPKLELPSMDYFSYPAQPVPYNQPPQPNTFLIGGSEVNSNLSPRAEQNSASTNQPADTTNSYNQGLPDSLLQSNLLKWSEQNSNSLTPGSQAAELPPLVPNINIDPTTGRPLFNNDMEQLIETGVRSSKKKNFNLMSRMMLSKEAQEMLKKSGENPTPPVVRMTLANSIDAILQRLLMEEQTAYPGSIKEVVRVSNTPYGDLQIQVGPNYYDSVEAVPAGRIKQLLQQAIERWHES